MRRQCTFLGVQNTDLARSLALGAAIAAAVPFYFFVFWTWFDFWRKHRVLTYTMMFGTFAASGVLVVVFHHVLLRVRIDMPIGVRAAGWVVISVATIFGFIADRQIGIRIRSFAPFFEPAARIRLRTTGAYGVVRHPIYTAGRVFIFGIFLVTGYLCALVGYAVFGLGSIWFTRREEERLIALLDDPTEYERYRRRVPALVPFLKPRRSSA
jgi:protein-S-isoprenylcysteine O-methyltransferase Ste14